MTGHVDIPAEWMEECDFVHNICQHETNGPRSRYILGQDENGDLYVPLHRGYSPFGGETLNVSTVKNRGGKFDPSGLDFVSLEFIGDKHADQRPQLTYRVLSAAALNRLVIHRLGLIHGRCEYVQSCEYD